jgi:hypothetical protein
MRGSILLILLVCIVVCSLCLSPIGTQDCQAAWDAPAAVCASGYCAVGERLVAGQPVRNVGRVALAPMRAIARLQPLRRTARAVGQVVAAPFRLLMRR